MYERGIIAIKRSIFKGKGMNPRTYPPSVPRASPGEVGKKVVVRTLGQELGARLSSQPCSLSFFPAH